MPAAAAVPAAAAPAVDAANRAGGASAAASSSAAAAGVAAWSLFGAEEAQAPAAEAPRKRWARARDTMGVSAHQPPSGSETRRVGWYAWAFRRRKAKVRV